MSESQQAYDVTIFNPDDPRAGVSSAFAERVDAASEADAREQVVESGSARTTDDVIEVKPAVERVRVEIRGTEDEIDGAMEGIADATMDADAEMSAIDDDAYVHFEAGDDENADVYSVENWRDVLMRITGLAEGLGDGDGMDVTASQLAGPDSTVEFMIGNEVLAKITVDNDG